MPGQVGKNAIHQLKSALASRLRVTWWCRQVTVVPRSIRQQRKILPGGTTLQAKASLPIRERGDRFVQACARARY